MIIPFGELKSEFHRIEGEIHAAIEEVLQSAWYILGAQGRAFEEEFAAYLGTAHAVGVASGTDAIRLALMATGVRPGDDVITVANTCVPTVCAIDQAGARPVLVDVDPVTLTLDPARIADAITERTRAIVPVHLYGHPCDMDPILAVAAAHNLSVVEDCAQAHGSLYKGKPCGTFGHAAAFSFYPTKNLGAYGDGGAVVTNYAPVANELRLLRNYGEERRYLHTRHGVNSRLDEMQAAILRVKLRHLDHANIARRQRADLYTRLLAGTAAAPQPEMAWARTNHHLFVVRCHARDALQARLKERGIGTLIHYPIPIHLQPAYLGLARGSYPISELACNEVLSLPMYADLPLEDVERVAEAVASFKEKAPVP